MIIKPPLYDYLKALAQLWLPALGTLYFALAGIWGLPAAEQVVGTILAVDTFLGIILGISASNFKSSPERIDGEFVISPAGDGTGTVNLNLGDNHPEDLAKKDEVVLKVAKPKAKGQNLVNPDSPPLASASRHRTGRRRK
jgi:hypothetical protein